MTTQEAAGVRKRMCAVFSETNGEEPVRIGPHVGPLPPHGGSDSVGARGNGLSRIPGGGGRHPRGTPGYTSPGDSARRRLLGGRPLHSHALFTPRRSRPRHGKAGIPRAVPPSVRCGLGDSRQRRRRARQVGTAQRRHEGPAGLHARLARHLLRVHRPAHVFRAPFPILEFPHAGLEAFAYRRAQAGPERNRHAERKILVETHAVTRQAGGETVPGT